MLGRQLHLFTIFGFQVKLDLSWLLLALLISWSLGAGVYPQEYPDLAQLTYAWMGIAVAIGVFFSIVFHEFAHSIIARNFGLSMRGITLFIFGGVAQMETEPPSPRAEFMIAIAGPISSFLLAGVFWIIATTARANGWPDPVIGVSETMLLINMTVAIFNLVPAFPLDGGRVLRAALWHHKRDLRAATFTSSRIGRLFGTALMVIGGIAVFRGYLIGGMWWFLIGLFVRGAASASFQNLVVNEMVKDQPVSRFMRRNPITVPPSATVLEWLEDYVYPYHFKMYPVVDGSTLLGCINIEAIRALPKSARAITTVAALVQPCSEENTIAADTSTSELLSGILNSNKQSRYMVVDQGKLVGMISLKDLLELISLKLELEGSQK
jgi:Zn-dependent protease/predicted transcriptional regulator